jgi:hypothetical protein
MLVENRRHDLVGRVQHSVFGRLAGYADVNDARCLRDGPARRRDHQGQGALDRCSFLRRLSTRGELVGASDQMAGATAQMHALQRLGEPDDIAPLGAFLLSNEASWITGQIMGADGAGRPCARGAEYLSNNEASRPRFRTTQEVRERKLPPNCQLAGLPYALGEPGDRTAGKPKWDTRGENGRI